MPHQAHRDHGVTGTTHWLLDEDLIAERGRRRLTPVPALLMHEPVVEPEGAAPAEPLARVPRRNLLLFVASLIAGLLVFGLLKSAEVGGALERFFGSGDDGQIRVTASFDEPGPRETASLRSLLDAIAPPAPTTTEGRNEPSGSSKPGKSGKPKPPGPIDGVTPPPPPPPPVIPELPTAPELPTLPKLPTVPELDAPSLPSVPELPSVTTLQLSELP